MKFFLPFFFFTFIFADVIINNVHFTDKEVNMTLLELNYIDYRDLNNILNSSYLTNQVLYYRFNNRGIVSLQDLATNTSLTSEDFYNLKQYAYKYTSDMIVEPIGTTYPLTNFLYALAGILIGFTILFAIIFHFAR